ITLRLGRIPQAVVALTQVVQERRIVRLQGQGRLEAFPCGSVLATLKEVNAVLVIFAEPLLGCGLAPSQAQRQRQEPTQPPHTALPSPTDDRQLAEKREEERAAGVARPISPAFSILRVTVVTERKGQRFASRPSPGASGIPRARAAASGRHPCGHAPPAPWCERTRPLRPASAGRGHAAATPRPHFCRSAGSPRPRRRCMPGRKGYPALVISWPPVPGPKRGRHLPLPA